MHAMLAATRLLRSHLTREARSLLSIPPVRHALVVGAASGAAIMSLCMSTEEWLAQPLDQTAAATVAQYEKEENSWVRVDEALIKSSGGGGAIFGSLGADTNAVKLYRIYAKRDGSEVAAVASFGGRGCSGHPGIVHGGVSALLFDNTIGFANAVSKLAEDKELESLVRQFEQGKTVSRTPSTRRFGFTASLTVNYRSPCNADSTVVLNCKLKTVEGRKRTLVATMVDADNGKLIADASALFVIPRPPPSLFQRVVALLGLSSMRRE